MSVQQASRRSSLVHSAIMAALPIFLGSPGSASAQQILNTTTTVADQSICMQKAFGTSPLTCTANDIRISKAVGAAQENCIKGETFDLEAIVEIAVNATSRYDTAFFFRGDGKSARGDGATGEGNCSVITFDAPPPANAPAVDLDKDSVGDLLSGTYTVMMTIPGVMCDDTDGDGFLNVPNCTSWHSKPGTVADGSNAYSLKPDTKSKCNCDDSFNVPVEVELTELEVTKTAVSTLAEPGGAVTFTVTIENLKGESVDILSIVDDKLGDLGVASATASFYDNDCHTLISTTLGGAGSETDSASCSFKADIWGNAGDTHTNVVDVTAYQPSRGQNIEGSDDHTITLTDEYDAPSLTKTPTAIANCSMQVEYAVEVRNNSEVDTMTIDGLTDNLLGDITLVQGDVLSTTCANGETVDTNSVYSCSFIAEIHSATCDLTHTNTVIATVTDDDGTESTPDGMATVTLSVGGVD